MTMDQESNLSTPEYVPDIGHRCVSDCQAPAPWRCPVTAKEPDPRTHQLGVMWVEEHGREVIEAVRTACRTAADLHLSVLDAFCLANVIEADAAAPVGGVLPSNPPDPLIEISSADALDEFLMDANDLGETPTFAAIDGNGVAFLASLQEVGGDCTQVVYIGTDEDGGPGGRSNCDECGDRVSDWAPKFPIRLVVVR